MRSILVVLGVVGLLTTAAASFTQAANATECEEIEGKLAGAFTGPLSTAGTISGGKLLNGTTAFAGDDLEPSAGLDSALVPASTVSYTGRLVITTGRGTLTLRDVGIFGTAVAAGEGEFASRSRVLAGTGLFEGATGILFFHGDTAADFTFTADVNGRICVVED